MTIKRQIGIVQAIEDIVNRPMLTMDKEKHKHMRDMSVYGTEFSLDYQSPYNGKDNPVLLWESQHYIYGGVSSFCSDGINLFDVIRSYYNFLFKEEITFGFSEIDKQFLAILQKYRRCMICIGCNNGIVSCYEDILYEIQNMSLEWFLSYEDKEICVSKKRLWYFTIHDYYKTKTYNEKYGTTSIDVHEFEFYDEGSYSFSRLVKDCYQKLIKRFEL